MNDKLADEARFLLVQDFDAKKQDLRLVQERQGDRRSSTRAFQGSCRRKDIRRTDEQTQLERYKTLVSDYKNENERLRKKNARLRIPNKEEILWRTVMFSGVGSIFIWQMLIS